MTIPVLTSQEMKAVEEATGRENGLGEGDMIQAAGEAVFESIKNLLEETSNGEEREPGQYSVAFVCGKGHNGADGLAAAFLAAQAGYGVVVYQLHSDHPYDAEVQRFQDQLKEAGVAINVIKSPLDLPVFQEVSLIVDALLGSGLNQDPEGILQSCIFGMNQSHVPILSVDIPSGIYGDNPRVPDSTVEADATICLGAMKLSAVFYPSSLAFGKVGYSPICFDEKLLAAQPSRMNLYAEDDAIRNLPRRSYRDNKYTVGKVLVIAGSQGMHGAGCLAANAALRAGAGMVKLAVPDGIYPEASRHLLEVIGVPIGKKSLRFGPEAAKRLLPLVEWAEAVVLGPGLGKAPETVEFLKELVPALTRPVVLDGEGLAYFNPFTVESPAKRAYNDFILTPHGGEYAKMGGKYDYDDPAALIADLRAFSGARGLHVALKGATTMVARPGGEITFLPAGNPGLATAGTGDVLAGTIAAFAAVLPVDQAACLGVYTHGRPADIARREKGTLGMAASDLLIGIPLALKELEDSEADYPAPPAASGPGGAEGA